MGCVGMNCIKLAQSLLQCQEYSNWQCSLVER